MLYIGWFIITGLCVWTGIMGDFNNPFHISVFFVLHLLSVAISFFIAKLLYQRDETFKKRLFSRSFKYFILVLGFVPVIGPSVVVLFLVLLRYYPFYPVSTESFSRLTKEILLITQERIAGRTIPITEAFLIRGLSREDSIRLVGIMGEMEWSSIKTLILKYIIRLSPYESAVLMAIDLITEKLNSLLNEISALEIEPELDVNNMIRLSYLYHEIYYLDLCEPTMKPFYEEKACSWAIEAFKKSQNEDHALIAVKYLLEAGKKDQAKEILSHIQQRGGYFFPKWIAYEFEIALHDGDIDKFEDLYLLIESAGGVFIPSRVKEAAKAWKRVLTSAYL
jgi:hypothetical protein